MAKPPTPRHVIGTPPRKPPKSMVGKVVFVSALLFAAAIAWRTWQGLTARGLGERLRRDDPETHAKLATEARSSGRLAKDLEKATEKGATRKNALSVMAVGSASGDAWAQQALERVFTGNA